MDYQLKSLQNEIIRLQLEDIKGLRDKDIFFMFQNIIEKIKDIREGKEVYTKPITLKSKSGKGIISHFGLEG